MTQSEIQTRINEQRSIINTKKAQLRDYDYIGVKIAMGVAKKSDYTEIIQQTEALRADINAAESEILTLEAIAPEDLEVLEAPVGE